MIFDVLTNQTRYACMDPNLAAAFEFLSSIDLKALVPGRINLLGDDLYVLVQEYTTKPADEGKWESHQKYIDVQYLVSGMERVGFAHISTMQLGDYLPDKVFQAMTGSGDTLDLFPGSFVIFHPEDAHMPGLQAGGPAAVKKVVVKVRV